MLRALILLLALVASPVLAAVTAASPDGRLVVTIETDGDGRPLWSLARDGKAVIAPSRLGFILADAPKLERNFKIAGEDRRSSDTKWEQPWGERSFVRDHFNEVTVHLAETKTPGRTLDLVFRLHDEGIGFRYYLPMAGKVGIVQELTEFSVAKPGKAWWIPALEWNREEYLYRKTAISEVGIAQTPLTIRTDDGLYLSFHEAALVDYAGMNLQSAGNGLFRAALTPSATGPAVVRDGPFDTPWRTVMVSDTAAGLANSSLILNLNAPNALGDVSWVKPCRYVGIWWGMHLGKQSWASGPIHGATTKNALKMIDFAAANGFCGVLIEGWNKGWDGDWFANGEDFSFTEAYPDFDLPKIAAYAKKRGVKIIGHHETSGNIAHYEDEMAAGFDLYRKHGIDAVKTGYVADAGGLKVKGPDGKIAYEWHEGQASARHHLKVLTEAAKRQIAINSHEPIKDTGLRRTYPNWVSREGARGMEFNAWGGGQNGFPGNGPEHEATLVFTRMLAGPMDYTPGVVSLMGKDGQRIPSTLAKQLALYVVLYSPLQMAADLPEHYAAQPEAFRFIKQVPVDWAESITLAGEPGEYAVTARKDRNSESWFLGAAGGIEPRDIDVPLAFLTPGQRYTAEIWRDGAKADWQAAPFDMVVEKRVVTSADRLALRLAAGGGTAVRFTPAGKGK